MTELLTIIYPPPQNKNKNSSTMIGADHRRLTNAPPMLATPTRCPSLFNIICMPHQCRASSGHMHIRVSESAAQPKPTPAERTSKTIAQQQITSFMVPEPGHTDLNKTTLNEITTGSEVIINTHCIVDVSFLSICSVHLNNKSCHIVFF